MIGITGATGQLGRLVVSDLLEAGLPAGDILAAVRNPGKAADLAAIGVTVREADYDRPESLWAAFAGVDRLLLISGSEVGARVRQHQNAIDVAQRAGVAQVVYTSILKADTTSVALAPEHKATEEAIVASGLQFSFLRNGWYLENYLGDLTGTIERGVPLGAAATGGSRRRPAPTSPRLPRP